MSGQQQSEREVLTELGEKIRRARIAADLTQEDAAHKSGIDYKRWQRLEQGAVNPTIRTLLRIAHALKMDVWSLLCG